MKIENYKGYEIHLYKTKGNQYTATASHPTRKTHRYLSTSFYKTKRTPTKKIKAMIDYFAPLKGKGRRNVKK